MREEKETARGLLVVSSVGADLTVDAPSAHDSERKILQSILLTSLPTGSSIRSTSRTD